jgi:protocatechuate 3,4-dioxygenase beta subunit
MDTKKIGRREALGMMGAASAAIALGCGSSPAAPSTTVEAAPATSGSTSAACAVTPAETAGPFPSLTHLFRSDIRDGKPGTLLNLGIKVVNTNAGCAPVADANVEIWHVDAAGNYSEYGSQTTQNFLRGVQTTDAGGQVSFTTIFPGWYQGRATHIHIEVTMAGASRKVTQIAFPESVNNAVYGTGVYAPRGTNPIANASDGIFADSLSSELVTPTGDPASGYSANVQVAIAL